METNENVVLRLSRAARLTPTAPAICEPGRQRGLGQGGRSYHVTTYEELDFQTDRIARGLLHWGCRPGNRLVLAVPFGTQFIKLTFALMKAGVVPVLVDPGMGRKYLIECLRAINPDGFVAIPKAQMIRTLMRRKFPAATWNVTVGRRLFWGGKTLRQIEVLGNQPSELPTRRRSDEAAIIFTTGSTGPPKGVQYTHDIFHHQIDLIRSRYHIRPGGRDLACFPLFGLFDAMMGVTTIIPDMDPTRPADVDPGNILEAVEQWEIDQAFGSPALWNTVSRWCEQTGNRLPTLRRILSAGAPVPPAVLARLRKAVHPDAEIFTPYGATESLPVASIESREILEETAAESNLGRGTCVGTRFDSIEWKVIAIDDGPIEQLSEVRELAAGQIGELLVAGPVITERYVTRLDQNSLHKVLDGDRVWHRMGDVGYLDSRDRFWFCGRKAHRVITAERTMFTVPCEAIFNTHPMIQRSALVGVGPLGNQTPVLVVEPIDEAREFDQTSMESLRVEWIGLARQHALTESIDDIRVYPKRLPVDIRHNSKIFREQLRVWAEQNPC